MPRNMNSRTSASESYFGELFNKAAVPLCFIDDAGGTLHFNARFINSFGYTHEEVRTLNEWWQLTAAAPGQGSATPATCEAAIRKAVEAKTDIEPIEYRVTCKNGDRRIVVISGSAIGHGVLLTFYDVTERKRIEDTLRFTAQLGWTGQSDSFLTSLVQYLGETLGVDYVLIDRVATPATFAETVALYAKGKIVPNLQYCLTGTPCENVMGKRLCYYPSGVQELFPADTLLAEMGVESYAGIPLWDQSGRGIGLIAVMDGNPLQDKEAVTQTLQLVAVSAAAFLEREMSDLLLRQREQEFRTLANNIPDMIVRYDSRLRRTFVNHAWEEASGLAAADVVNVPAANIPKVPAPIVVDYLEKIRRVLAVGSSEKIEFCWENARGKVLFLEYLIVPEHDQEGEIVGVLSVGRDITERKLDEQERQAHLRYFESMDRINRSLHGANDLERMMNDVLDEVLAIFECDRAWLIYPCDPDAATWWVPVERTRPEYPGALALHLEMPVDAEVARVYRAVLASDEPVGFGPGNEEPLPAEVAEQFNEQSQLAMALHPRTDKPYLFGLHQCSRPRAWTVEERRLFKEIGRRLTDSLTSVLMYSDLQESERRYRLVFENSPVSIWEEDFSGVSAFLGTLKQDGVTDLEEYFDRHPQAVGHCAELVQVIDVNRAALALHGAADKEELLAGLMNTFAPESFDTFRQELLCLWDGATEMTRDAVVKTLEGERRQVTVSFSVCPGYESTFAKVLVSLADITARKEAEASLRKLNAELELRVKQRTVELEESRLALLNLVQDLNLKTDELKSANSNLQELDRLKSMFVASMSHELRTPLNSIIGFSSIIGNEWLGPVNPEQKENIEIIRRAGKHLLNLINDVIDVSKIEAGKIEVRVEEFDLYDLVTEAVQYVERDMSEKGLQLRLQIGHQQLRTDRHRLLQCVINLLSNAVKFTPQGEIGISSSLADTRTDIAKSADGRGSNSVVITVSDTGIGIAEKDFQALFKPFARLESPLKAVVPGTGLGLYLTNKLAVEVFKGNLECSSVHGKGSTFTLRIPVQDQ